MTQLAFGHQTTSELSTQFVYAIKMWDIDPETMESLEPEPIRGNTEWAFTAYDNPSEGD